MSLARLSRPFFEIAPTRSKTAKLASVFFCSLQGRRDATVGATFEKWEKIFEENSVSEPRESIESILAHQLGTKRISDMQKFKDRLLSEEELEGVRKMCEIRLKRKEPVPYITGEWDFRDMTLKMMPPVFIPWPETEQLVDIVLEEVDSKRCKHVLDICTGSGAIAVALLKSRPQLKVTAVDGLESACRLAMENAKKYGADDRLSTIHSRMSKDNRLDFIKEKFDVIVSNPPYVPVKDVQSIFTEINEHQDSRALNGGVDGTDIIKMVLAIASRLLNAKGAILMEVHPTHPPLINAFLNGDGKNLGLRLDNTYKDFRLLDRYVKVMKN